MIPKTHETFVVGCNEKKEVVFFKSYDYDIQKDEAQSDLKWVIDNCNDWFISTADNWKLIHKDGEIAETEFTIKGRKDLKIDVDFIVNQGKALLIAKPQYPSKENGYNRGLHKQIEDNWDSYCEKAAEQDVPNTDAEKFELANDMDFHDACLDFIDGRKPLRSNPLQTIGDRVRLIKCLEAKGFKISKL